MVTEIIGVCGFLLSLFLAVLELLRYRQQFSLEIIDYADFGPSVRFFVCVVNRSRKPLVITRVIFHETVSELEPKKIRGEPTAWNGAVTPHFPVSIPPVDARNFYIEFVNCEGIALTPDMSVTFQIHTIRRPVYKTVSLGKRAHYLNRKG